MVGTWRQHGNLGLWGAARSALILAISLVLALAVLVAAQPPQARAAAGDLALTKSAGTVLVGGTAPFTLTATNRTGSSQYNLSFADVLPDGATYLGGSTAPASYGDPTMTTVADGPDVSHQVLVWSNLVDIAPGASVSLSYQVTVPAATFPLGSIVPNSAVAAVNSNPFVVPDFAADGSVRAGTATDTGSAAVTPTVSAIQLTKSADNVSENELLRGVGDHQAVYRLTVTNNDSTAVHNATVVDYLPAGLEFLGCGDRDISPAEYPGAGRDVRAVTGCVQPSTVETVQDPAGYPVGVYTKVTWALGTLNPASVTRLPYAVGIPMRANTMSFGGTTPATSGAQIANLDNNNGASTREPATEQSLENRAVVSANFGAGNGQLVSDTARSAVTAEDLTVVKSANTTSFVQGEVVTYTLRINTSEYVEAADLTVTDVLPAGLCPAGAVSGGAFEDCDPTGGSAPSTPNATFTATPDGNGSYTLRFTPSRDALTDNDELVISYNAVARTSYATSSPTSAMDAFTNSVEITGATTPRPGIGSPESGSQAVADASSWTLAAAGPVVTKLRQQNPAAASPQSSCSLQPSQYTRSPAADEAPYRLGDLACFLIRIRFSDAADTRSAALTDFLPSNLSYAPSLGGVVAGAGLVADSSTSSSGRVVTWTFQDRVPRGADFAVVVAARVTGAVAGGEDGQPIERSNLAKFRFANTPGQNQALRDSIDAPFAPAAPIGLDKSVQAVNGAATNTGPRVDSNDTVTFGVKLSNLATDATAYSALSGIVVWDLLPTGITCAAVSQVGDGGACDPATNRIVWTVGTPAAPLAAGADRTLTYTMAVPSDVGVSTSFTNRAGVVSYQTPTNLTGSLSTHYPANNIDPATDPSLIDVPAADDTASVNTADATVTKAATTRIVEAGNTASQATIGELVDYRIDLVVPARTSVFNGLLTDSLPAGLTFVGPASAELVGGTLPSNVRLVNATASADLKFDGAYANTTDADQVFRVTFPARVNLNSGNVHGVSLTNQAKFVSYTAVTGGTALPDRTASAGLTVVEPSATLSKSRTPSAAQVAGGTEITYSLVAGNASGTPSPRPPLHDAVVVDCVPAGLVVGTITAPSGTSASAALNSCGAGNTGTQITWTIGDIAGATTKTLTYQATITGAAGSQSYANTATLTGSSLDDGVNGGPSSPDERVSTASANNTVRVAPATVVKSANPAALTIGQRGSWTVTVTLPANLAFFDSTITDAVPAGFLLSGLTTDSVSCTGFGGSCPARSALAASQPAPPTGAATIGWSVGDIAASPLSRTISVTYSAVLADVAGNAAGTTTAVNKTNTAYYRWNLSNLDTPPAVGNALQQSASGAVSVRVVEPAVVMAKSVSDSTPDPGDLFTYTVTATNNGRAANNLSPAYNLTVVDAVPAGVEPQTINDGGTWDPGSRTITWTYPGPIGTAVGSNSASFSYTAELAPSATLTGDGLVNSVSAPRYESLASDGRTSYTAGPATATVTPQFPNVTNAKSVDPGPAYAGVAKTWTITLTNSGGAVANDAVITDVLPKNWLYQPGTAAIVVAGSSQPLPDSTFLASSIADGVQSLVWTTPYDIPAASAANPTAVLTFQAVPQPGAVSDPGAGSATRHTNTVTSVVTDATGATRNATANYAGPPASADTRIDSADLKVVKTSDGRAVAGGVLTYTLQVSNTTENSVGADQAVGPFTVTDTLPSGLGTLTASGTGWTCSVSSTTLTCSRGGTLNAGAAFPAITVRAAIPSDTAAGTSLTNTATVSGSTYDPRLVNNTSAVTDTVTRQVDLQLTKAVSSSPVVAGQNLTYTLDVRNDGISDSASGVFTVTDTLPAGLRYVSATGTGWSCDESGGTITCTTTGAPAVTGTLPTITVTATVASSVTGTISNSASVAGPEPGLDPNTANNSSTATLTPATSADLALTKAHSTGADDWVAGGTGTYTFTVLNHGPSDAAAPQVVDTLPSSLTFVPGSVSGTDWTCSASGQTVTCGRDGALAGGTGSAPTSERFSFRVRVAASLPAGTNIHNDATVSSTTSDPNPGNNAGTDDTGTTQRADLGITKSGPGTAVAGDGTISFTLGVRNDGESDTPAPVAGSIDPITVVDTLPDGISYAGFSGTNWSCSATGQTVTCTLSAGLAAGADAPALTIRAAVAAEVAAGTLTNYASVSGPLGDPRPGNNTDSTAVTTTVSPSLRIAKTADPAAVRAGEQVSYTIRVDSTGPSDATNLELSDPLAAGLVFVSIDGPSGWTCSATAAECAAGRLAAGRSATFTVMARVGSGVADASEIVNAATVTADGGLSESDDARVTVTAEADLRLAKSHADPDQPILAGQSVSFALNVRNSGPSDAQPAVTVVDTLPAGMTFAGSTGVWNCTAAGQVVTCVLPEGTALLAGDDAPPLTISATVAADLDSETVRLTNSAAVSSGTADPDPGNNTATDEVLVGRRAALSISKSHDPASVRVGDPLTFTLQVTNAGPSVARNAVVTDTLPDSLAYVGSDGGADWTCRFAAPRLECAANADLPVGTPSAITVTTTVTAAAYPSVENTATVASDTPDLDDSDNSATDAVRVPAEVDLSVTKSHGSGSLQVGQQSSYSLTVTNSGATDDPGTVTVADALPAGLSFVSGTGDGWTCAATGQEVSCQRPGGLATGQVSVITLVVAVGPQAYPSVTNIAGVSSPAEDTDPADNTASDPATVLPQYGLSLAKAVKGVAGSTVSWTLAVSNAGPNEAPTGASVTDTLPSALTFSSAAGDGWTCAVSGQVVSCDHPGAIAPGRTVSVVLTTAVAAGFSGELSNTATLSGEARVATATATIPGRGGGELAYTGGVALGGGVLGLVLVGGGLLLIRLRRRA